MILIGSAVVACATVAVTPTVVVVVIAATRINWAQHILCFVYCSIKTYFLLFFLITTQVNMCEIYFFYIKFDSAAKYTKI